VSHGFGVKIASILEPVFVVLLLFLDVIFVPDCVLYPASTWHLVWSDSTPCSSLRRLSDKYCNNALLPKQKQAGLAVHPATPNGASPKQSPAFKQKPS
jgi:hypothetical protein